MTQMVRANEMVNIQRFTTPNGYSQITNDILMSRNDPRLKMLVLRNEDIRRTIPIQIYFLQGSGKNRLYNSNRSIVLWETFLQVVKDIVLSICFLWHCDELKI